MSFDMHERKNKNALTLERKTKIIWTMTKVAWIKSNCSSIDGLDF